MGYSFNTSGDVVTSSLSSYRLTVSGTRPSTTSRKYVHFYTSTNGGSTKTYQASASCSSGSVSGIKLNNLTFNTYGKAYSVILYAWHTDSSTPPSSTPNFSTTQHTITITFWPANEGCTLDVTPTSATTVSLKLTVSYLRYYVRNFTVTWGSKSTTITVPVSTQTVTTSITDLAYNSSYTFKASYTNPGGSTGSDSASISSRADTLSISLDHHYHSFDSNNKVNGSGFVPKITTSGNYTTYNRKVIFYANSSCTTQIGSVSLTGITSPTVNNKSPYIANYSGWSHGVSTYVYARLVDQNGNVCSIVQSFLYKPYFWSKPTISKTSTNVTVTWPIVPNEYGGDSGDWEGRIFSLSMTATFPDGHTSTNSVTLKRTNSDATSVSNTWSNYNTLYGANISFTLSYSLYKGTQNGKTQYYFADAFQADSITVSFSKTEQINITDPLVWFKSENMSINAEAHYKVNPTDSRHYYRSIFAWFSKTATTLSTALKEISEYYSDLGWSTTSINPDTQASSVVETAQTWTNIDASYGDTWNMWLILVYPYVNGVYSPYNYSGYLKSDNVISYDCLRTPILDFTGCVSISQITNSTPGNLSFQAKVNSSAFSQLSSADYTIEASLSAYSEVSSNRYMNETITQTYATLTKTITNLPIGEPCVISVSVSAYHKKYSDSVSMYDAWDYKTLYPTTYSWTYPKVKGEEFKLTALEWNNYMAHLKKKYLYVTNVEHPSAITSANDGDAFTAVMFNQAVNLAQSTVAYTNITSFNLTEKQRRDPIKADYFKQLLDVLNGNITKVSR